MCYHLNTDEKAIVSSKTGALVRPKCFDELAAFHSYLLGKGKRHDKEAQQMLKDVFHGRKFISDLIAKSQANKQGSH
jgi:predicted SprT family Zn-dependent metalloprotease